MSKKAEYLFFLFDFFTKSCRYPTPDYSRKIPRKHFIEHFAEYSPNGKNADEIAGLNATIDMFIPRLFVEVNRELGAALPRCIYICGGQG